MSIINEALQKIKPQHEKLASRTQSTSRGRSIFKFNKILLFLMLILVSYSIFYLAGFFKPLFLSYQKQRENIIAKQTPNLSLHGIFMSDKFKTALINNQYVKVGDSIEGKKVMTINEDNVTLSDKNKIIVLHMPI